MDVTRIVIIAHRLGLIDNVIIAEKRSFDELIALEGMFAKLVKM